MTDPGENADAEAFYRYLTRRMDQPNSRLMLRFGPLPSIAAFSLLYAIGFLSFGGLVGWSFAALILAAGWRWLSHRWKKTAAANGW